MGSYWKIIKNILLTNDDITRQKLPGSWTRSFIARSHRAYYDIVLRWNDVIKNNFLKVPPNDIKFQWNGPVGVTMRYSRRTTRVLRQYAPIILKLEPIILSLQTERKYFPLTLRAQYFFVDSRAREQERNWQSSTITLNNYFLTANMNIYCYN